MRLSTLRGSVKKIAASEVKGFYHLIPGDACKDRVKDLITKTEYIYSRCTSVSPSRATSRAVDAHSINLFRQVYFFGPNPFTMHVSSRH